MTRRRRIAAAVDVGSYSVHLLVAEVHGRRLRPLHDESAFLGLGREIDVTGELGQARDRLVEAMSRFIAKAKALDASTITVVGTDPLRRAADAMSARREVREATGLSVGVLGHEEEALIALIGVQAGRPVLRDTVLVDAGGGSTEILVAGPGREPVAMGLQLGVTRLTGMHVEHDPPTDAEVRALLRRTRAAFASAPDVAPSSLIAVGGTARSLLRVGPRLANRALTRRRIRRALDHLSEAPAEVVAQRFGIRLSRTKVLAAGAAILLGALDRYRLERLRVAEGGLREGVILSVARAGPGWRDHLRDLARGWDH